MNDYSSSDFLADRGERTAVKAYDRRLGQLVVEQIEFAMSSSSTERVRLFAKPSCAVVKQGVASLNARCEDNRSRLWQGRNSM